MLVKFEKLGGGAFWANPKDVTSIEFTATYAPETWATPELRAYAGHTFSKVWVRGNAGYGTYSVRLVGSGDEIAARLNEAEHESALA